MNLPLDLVILAGGMGTRLQGTIGDLPKCLAPVAGRPFIDHLLDYLNHWEFGRIILSIGYRKEQIVSHFKVTSDKRFVFAEENTPLGTGGAIRFAAGFSQADALLVMNGDTFFKIDIDRMVEIYAKSHADAVIALREVEDTSRYGRVDLNADGRITAFQEKSFAPEPGFINGGVYLLNRGLLEHSEWSGSFSFERDFLPQVVSSKQVYGVPFNEYFIDIGIPQDFQQAQSDFIQPQL